jgi:hypothetical protein
MQATIVEIDTKELYEGALVFHKRNDAIYSIKSIPSGMGIYESVKKGIFDIKTHADYDTVMNNKQLFELVNDFEINEYLENTFPKREFVYKYMDENENIMRTIVGDCVVLMRQISHQHDYPVYYYVKNK